MRFLATVLALFAFSLAMPAHAEPREMPKAVREKLKSKPELLKKAEDLWTRTAGATGKVSELTVDDVKTLKEIEEHLRDERENGEPMFKSYYGAIRSRAGVSQRAVVELNKYEGLKPYEKPYPNSQPAVLSVVTTGEANRGVVPSAGVQTGAVADVNTGTVGIDATKRQQNHQGRLRSFATVPEPYPAAAGDAGSTRQRRQKVVSELDRAEREDSKAIDPIAAERLRRERAIRAMHANDPTWVDGVNQLLQLSPNQPLPPGASSALEGMSYSVEVVDGVAARLFGSPDAGPIRARAAKLEAKATELEAEAAKLKSQNQNEAADVATRKAALLRLDAKGLKRVADLRANSETAAVLAQLRAVAPDHVRQLERLEDRADKIRDEIEKTTDAAKRLELERELSEVLEERAKTLIELYTHPALAADAALYAKVQGLRAKALEASVEEFTDRVAERLASTPEYSGKPKDETLNERKKAARNRFCGGKCKFGLHPALAAALLTCSSGVGQAQPTGGQQKVVHPGQQ